MTRAEILAAYSVDNGRITSPARFEGEPIYAPHFWDAIVNGCSDETIYDGDKPYDWFEVSAEDRAEFPELADIAWIVCSEDDNGFSTAANRPTKSGSRWPRIAPRKMTNHDPR